MAVCTYQIYSLYSKWQANPVIVTFDTNPTPIWKIPFPAVTICPQSKSNHTEFILSQLLNKTRQDYSSFERRSLYALAHLCRRDHSLFKSLRNRMINQDVIGDLLEFSLDSMKLIHRMQFKIGRASCRERV